MLQSFWKRGARKCWNGRRGDAKSYEQVYSNLVRTRASLIRELAYIVWERDCYLTTSHPYSDISKWLH